MKKILILLSISIVFYTCKKEEETNSPPTIAASWDCINGTCIDPGTGNGTYNDSLVCVSSCNISPTVYDTLVGFWNLTHYDDGFGLENADTGQYINFLDKTDLNVNVQISGLTWWGDFFYEATSDSIHTMNSDYGLMFQSSQNMILSTDVGFFDPMIYYLYFEK